MTGDSHYQARGACDNPQKTKRQTKEFISLFHEVPFRKPLHTFGREMTFLKSIGRKIESYDMAIGATSDYESQLGRMNTYWALGVPNPSASCLYRTVRWLLSFEFSREFVSLKTSDSQHGLSSERV